MKSLRMLGVNRPEMTKLIGSEIKYMLSKIGEYGDEPVPFRTPMSMSASNVVNAVITGKRHDYDHPTRQLLNQVFQLSDDIGNFLFTGYFQNFLPIVKYLVRLPSKTRKVIVNNTLAFGNYVNEEIAMHVEKFDENNVHDILDAYIAEANSKKGSKTTIDCKFID